MRSIRAFIRVTLITPGLTTVWKDQKVTALVDKVKFCSDLFRLLSLDLAPESRNTHHVRPLGPKKWPA